MSWQALAEGQPALAEFGRKRLASGVAYLATIRKDGSPRVHPVTPIVGEGRLFLFMEPDSPKGYDLRRDGRYALHCAVENQQGGGGEFFISGRATLTTAAAARAVATRHAGYTPAARYILFELSVESALSNVYGESGPLRQRWPRGIG
jgi:hypothetical protein